MRYLKLRTKLNAVESTAMAVGMKGLPATRHFEARKPDTGGIGLMAVAKRQFTLGVFGISLVCAIFNCSAHKEPSRVETTLANMVSLSATEVYHSKDTAYGTLNRGPGLINGEATNSRRAPTRENQPMEKELRFDAIIPGSPGPAPCSDALVFFGATGDLAYKKIFPALQDMIRRGTLNIPVVGVAKSGWTIDQFRSRVRDSLTRHGGGVDERAFAKLVELLRYIDGDYQDPATFERLRQMLGGAARPMHYLAIPPDLFGTVIEWLGRSDCAQGARVIIEKPFGRDLASAQKLNTILHSIFPESSVFRIDHYLGKEGVENVLFSAL